MYKCYFFTGGVAIDNVQFFDCDQPAAAAMCDQSSNFWCTYSRACIPSEFVCDVSNDCEDNSDESTTACSGYTWYDFESSDAPVPFKQGQ